MYNLRERGGIRLTFIQLHAVSIIFHWFEPFSGFGHLRLAIQVYWWKLFTGSEGKLKESNGGALNHNNYAHCLLHNGHCSTTQLPICSFGQLAISPFIRCFILTRSALNSVQVCPGLSRSVSGLPILLKWTYCSAASLAFLSSLNSQYFCRFVV